jgi:hypothetical protein
MPDVKMNYLINLTCNEKTKLCKYISTTNKHECDCYSFRYNKVIPNWEHNDANSVRFCSNWIMDDFKLLFILRKNSNGCKDL